MKRSSKNYIFGGVCGGLAEYFGIDPLIIRALWAILIFFYGTGTIVYLLCWILIPRDSE